MISEQNLFLHPPLRVINGIPFFSAMDEYIANYEKIAEEHLASIDRGEGNPFMTEAHVRQVEQSTRSLLHKYVASGSAVLDGGIGPGFLLGIASEYRRYGIDISLAYLQRARSHGIEVAFSKVEDMPYRSAIFDAVVACDVLEHVLWLDKAITQLLRVLKPGGMLIVRVPNEESLHSYLAPDQPWEYCHVRRFDLSSLRLYFEKVFKLEFVVHEYSGWAFSILDQLRIRLPSQKSSLRGALSEPGMDIQALNVLRRVCDVSEEELVDALIEVRDQHPLVAVRLMPELITPLGITVVYRKPLDAVTPLVPVGLHVG